MTKPAICRQTSDSLQRKTCDLRKPVGLLLLTWMVNYFAAMDLLNCYHHSAEVTITTAIWGNWRTESRGHNDG